MRGVSDDMGGAAAVSAQERADRAAQELATAVAEMSGAADGETVIIVRSTMDGCTVQDGLASGQLLWTWDWFKRPKTEKPDT